jgi:hypothetical protein
MKLCVFNLHRVDQWVSTRESEFALWSGFLGAGTPLNLWGIGERDVALIRDQTAVSLAFGDATGFGRKPLAKWVVLLRSC